MGGGEARLRLDFLHGVPRGDERLFANHLAQVFVLLLETRLRERTGALSAALAERARLSLYLQHDMRNLAQWVSWVGADFVQADSHDSLMVVAQRLQANAPFALERAQRLMAALGNDQQASVPRPMALRGALEQAARLAGIEISITGDATAWITPELLERALDNLLSNLAADCREGITLPPVALIKAPDTREPGATVLVELLCQLHARGMDLPPERLFEPFASGRPGGLGLGLYQARHCLREAGGDLRAAVVEQQLRFTLLLPQECEKVDKTAVAMAPV
jgi:signal transduction histidine kinase